MESTFDSEQTGTTIEFNEPLRSPAGLVLIASMKLLNFRKVPLTLTNWYHHFLNERFNPDQFGTYASVHHKYCFKY